jgi:hypothetical protein
MRPVFFILLMMFSLFSCKNREKKITEQVSQEQYTPIAPKGMMDQINQADSAVVIFYNKPANPRFFKVFKVSNLGVLQSVISDINSAVKERKDNCQTLGKLYFYGKGDVVDVVYFSDADSCRSFSFIKNGEKYFTRMGDDAQRLIDSVKAYAK